MEDLDAEIRSIARWRKIVLQLPALFSEFETLSTPAIIAELRKANYLHAMVLSLDVANEGDYKKARGFMAGLPCPVKVVWHDGPNMQSLYRELRQNDFSLEHPGKRQSVWMALGYILSERDV